jgi:hypothetical protein
MYANVVASSVMFQLYLWYFFIFLCLTLHL